MKIVGVFGVRSGSLRVENKNLRPFAGSNLIELKIKQLKRISRLDEIVVNSNNEEMLDIARKHGCTAVKRSEYYATNTVPANEMYRNIAENCPGDLFVYATATNPLLKDETIDTLLDIFLQQNEFDSINTTHSIKEFLVKDNKPHNFSLDKVPRSQDLPDISALNFAVNILKKDTMIAQSHVVGKKPLFYTIDTLEATDIDEILDFEFAEFMYLKRLKEKEKM